MEVPFILCYWSADRLPLYKMMHDGSGLMESKPQNPTLIQIPTRRLSNVKDIEGLASPFDRIRDINTYTIYAHDAFGLRFQLKVNPYV